MQIESILGWFEKQQEDSSINVKRAEGPLIGQWEVDPNSSTPIERQDGKFFRIINVEVEAMGTREVDSWEQPMVEPAETKEIDGKKINGIIALFRLRTMQNIKFLVQAKPEPGNDTPGKVILAPTIQASASNMDLHKDKIPFLDQLDLESEDSRYVIQPKDGGRFFQTNNILATQDTKRFKVPPNYIWATRGAIRELQQKGLASEHLNEVLGVFG